MTNPKRRVVLLGVAASDYAELYANIDPVNHVLEIHEKDPDYRANVIKALAK